MNKARLAAALAALLILGACERGGEAGQPPLAGARLGGAFALTDQNGRRVTDRSFAGRYRLVYFGYTFCPDVCPNSLQTLMGGFQLLKARAAGKAAKLAPIFVTIDPERDTPAVMKPYVAAFGPELVGLTGTPAEIAAVAQRYGVSFARRQEAGASDYLMDHVSAAMLFGPDGQPIALIPQDGTREQVADELEKWIA